MLSCTGFGDDPFFAHEFRHHDLAQSVVDLVGACMHKVFPFQPDPAARKLAQSLRLIKGRRSSRIVFEKPIQLPLVFLVFSESHKGAFKFIEGDDQRFRYKLTAILSEVSFHIS